MKNKILVILTGLMFMFGIAGVYAYNSESPYTVTMNFIVGEDTSFTVALAGSETTIDFNPATANDKEVEPDSQDDGGSTPIETITNTGNVNLALTHELNVTTDFVAVSYNAENTVDWTKILNSTTSSINASVPSSETADVYMWANFTAADSGTTAVLYQINSTTA